MASVQSQPLAGLNPAPLEVESFQIQPPAHGILQENQSPKFPPAYMHSMPHCWSTNPAFCSHASFHRKTKLPKFPPPFAVVFR